MSDRLDEPAFRVVRGVPTAEELAALVGVITRLRAPSSTAPATEPTWVRLARPGAVTSTGLPAWVGRGAWRASALPR
ncbi:MAG TPA: acyl-CoA carboxylase subunit epsilon [Micromonosporaceae bacterium]